MALAFASRQRSSRKEKVKKALITGITGQDGSYLAGFLMLQQDEPDDYVIATGQQFSVRRSVTTRAS
jgi:GDP-D-mannose dehydratase